MLRPLLRRVLRVVGVGGAFLLLALLGSWVAALFSPGGAAPAEPEVVRPGPPPRPPAPARLPDPPPPPPPRPAPAHPPAPAPAETGPTSAPAAALPLTNRLWVRRDLIRAVNLLKRELAGCPSTRAEWVRGSRAALVLEVQGAGDGVQVLGTALHAEVPVNEQFVACARALLQGRTLATEGVPPGVRLRFVVPLGPGGSSLSLSSSSLIGAEEEPPR